MMTMASSVLVVDDEVASRESLADVLKEEGYEATAAASSEDHGCAQRSTHGRIISADGSRDNW